MVEQFLLLRPASESGPGSVEPHGSAVEELTAADCAPTASPVHAGSGSDSSDTSDIAVPDGPGSAPARPSSTPSDQLTTGTLQVIADCVAVLAGFRVVAIAIIENPQQFHVEAVSGSDRARAGLLNVVTPASSLTADLQSAEAWGNLRFRPGPAAYGATASGPSHAEGEWGSGDWLVAPFHSGAGELIGFIRVDEPADGRRPDPAALAILEMCAEQAGRAVSLAVQRRDLTEKVRLVTATREIVRHASRELEISALMAQIRRPLVTGFQALGMWFHAFDPDGSVLSTLYDSSDQIAELAPQLTDLAQRIAQDAWQRQQVGVVSASRLRGQLVSMEEVERVRTFLAETRVGSVLFIPVGVGKQCLGSLILARALDDVMWSEGEIEAALDLGHDLGQAILNARAFERERDLAQRLRALDAHKTALIATMSHELKSPLTAILANLELLDGFCDADPDARAGLGAVARGTERLVRLVDDLLVLAKVGDPAAARPATAVDLGAIVEEVADLKRAEACRSGVTICVDLPEEGMRVSADAMAIDLLVVNLLGNAVKYSPAGGLVTVSLAEVDEHVVLTCSDQGIGISPDDLPHIFDEFFRSGDKVTRAQPGTGLGLAIVDRIIRRHNGAVDVTSVVGSGSTFRVKLPSARTAALAEHRG